MAQRARHGKLPSLLLSVNQPFHLRGVDAAAGASSCHTPFGAGNISSGIYSIVGGPLLPQSVDPQPLGSFSSRNHGYAGECGKEPSSRSTAADRDENRRGAVIWRRGA